MRWSVVWSSIVVIAATLLFSPVPILGYDNKYTEDFTTTTFKNVYSTTAWWDDVAGELKLYPFMPTLKGTCSTPGSALGVAVSGDYLYVAHYSSFQVIDISDPSNPTLYGIETVPGYAINVVISGEFAFVADGDLQVIDISDPANPSLFGTCVTPGEARDVAVSGDYAFVADFMSGLQVIDITDPHHPTLINGYNTPNWASGVAVSGDRAFVADYSSLQVIDITDPTNPTLAGSYGAYAANDVVVSGDLAFVADNSSGLIVFDITDPDNPVPRDSVPTPGYAQSVAVSGDRAFVADEYAGLQVIDISDPDDLALAEGYDTPGNAYGVAVSGGHAFVADDNAGIQVISISYPVNPAPAGDCYSDVIDRGVAISGDHAFVTVGVLGLEVIDISDPTNPTVVGICDTPDLARGVAVSGDYAFVADNTSGLQVIDISDPTDPWIVASCDTPDKARDVAVSGNHAFVADVLSGLQVIDISDPTDPTLVGSRDTPVGAMGVAVSGDHAYVADYTSGLLEIDISDPADPWIARTFDTPGYAYDVAVSGSHAFVADHADGGLQVIDISYGAIDPLVGSCDTPGAAIDVAVSGDRAFVADGYDGLLAIDISDPEDPTIVGYYDSPAQANGVAVSGDFAFVTDYPSRFRVVQVFQSEFDMDRNVGRGLPINGSSDLILWANVTTTQADFVTWEISANYGIDWQGIPSDGSWNQIAVPGPNLIWRSTHAWSAPGVNPAVTDLEIKWLLEFAVIESIRDVGNDQGRQVSISWARSGYDYPGSATPIVEYAIYRKIDYDLSSAYEQAQPDAVRSSRILSTGHGIQASAYPPGDWHYIMTVPARCEDVYAAVVPTLADSTVAEGMYTTTYFVSAMTETPGVYFDSPPDSGYSVDNLSPQAPLGFAVTRGAGGNNHLAWEECPDADFHHFRIYRGESYDFVPGPGNLVHYTTGTEWDDPVEEGSLYHYKLTAVDFSGNESDAALASTVTGTDIPGVPEDFALYQNVPNPFNPVTSISFDLPRPGYVRLSVYNAKGELVATLIDGPMGAGPREVRWTGADGTGRPVSSGIYFYRIVAGDFVQTRKMVLLR